MWLICLVIKVVPYPLPFTPWLLRPIYLEPCTTFTPWHHHMTFTYFLIIAYTTSSAWTLLQSIYLFFVLEVDFMRQEGWLTMSKVVNCMRSFTILWLRKASWGCYRASRMLYLCMISKGWNAYILILYTNL